MQIDRINGLVGSIAVKVPCHAATTANITLSGAQTVDGVALVSNDRCLVKNQSTASENGIYDVSGTEWSRSLDFNGIRDIDQGTCVRIILGTVSGQYFYEVTTSAPLIGTTDIDFALVNFPTTTSTYMATLLDDETAPEAKTTLEVTDVYMGDADGTVDAITSTLTPVLTALTDNSFVLLRAAGANATTTPTFAPNGLSTQTIVKRGNQALAVGDIPAADYECILKYNSTNSVWELLNPNIALSEGTWTPTIQDTTYSDSEGQTYSAQSGTYTRIGNRVFISGSLTMTSIGTLSGALPAFIAGLPFTSSSNPGGLSLDFISGYQTNPAVADVFIEIEPSTTRASLTYFTGPTASTAFAVNGVELNWTIKFSGQYVTDA